MDELTERQSRFLHSLKHVLVKRRHKHLDSNIETHMMNNLKIMSTTPNSKEGQFLWQSTGFMKGYTPPPATVSEIDSDSDSNFNSESGSDVFAPQKNVDKTQNNNASSFQNLDNVNNNAISTLPLTTEQTIFADAFFTNDSKQAYEPDSDSDIQAIDNLITVPSITVPSYARPTVIPTPAPSLPQRKNSKQRQNKDKIPVFDAVPDDVVVGDQVRTIYCGLNSRNKPANAIFGNSLQCMRKGYNIGRGHVRAW